MGRGRRCGWGEGEGEGGGRPQAPPLPPSSSGSPTGTGTGQEVKAAILHPPTHLEQHRHHVFALVMVVVVQQHAVRGRAAPLGLPPVRRQQRHAGLKEALERRTSCHSTEQESARRWRQGHRQARAHPLAPCTAGRSRTLLPGGPMLLLLPAADTTKRRPRASLHVAGAAGRRPAPDHRRQRWRRHPPLPASPRPGRSGGCKKPARVRRLAAKLQGRCRGAAVSPAESLLPQGEECSEPPGPRRHLSQASYLHRPCERQHFCPQRADECSGSNENNCGRWGRSRSDDEAAGGRHTQPAEAPDTQHQTHTAVQISLHAKRTSTVKCQGLKLSQMSGTHE